MKVAFKPFGGKKTASTRLRVILPIKYINKRSQGITCELFEWKNIEEYSLVIFQKAYSAEDLALASLLKRRNVKIGFDLCDNHFFIPTQSRESEERVDRLRRIIALADAITVSNKGLGELSQRQYTVIDDMVEISIHTIFAQKVFGPLCHFKKRKRLRLVWFGTVGSEAPRFGMIDLEKIVPELNGLNDRVKIELAIISNSRDKYLQYLSSANFPTTYYEWNSITFSYIMQLQDVTVIPIDLNPFTVFKTNNRPVLSLLLGLPVVADKISSYEVLSEFIRFGNWKENIYAYWRDAALRRSDVARGRNFIIANYNFDTISNQWINFMKKYEK